MNLHNKSFNLPPPLNVPALVQKFVAVYKLWQEYRNHFPKKSRFSLGGKIDSLFIGIIELLFVASYLSKQEKLPYLQKAARKLDVLKFFFCVSWEIGALDNKKYTAISEHLNEIGRMLGGWIRGIQTKTPVR
ncbi:MAG: diversity-generating retroelement protein Avd [Proteobacteria bacterium]|nr:diversity-generating retroelement protein Avd [Pseudomonadota bacterium]